VVFFTLIFRINAAIRVHLHYIRITVEGILVDVVTVVVEVEVEAAEKHTHKIQYSFHIFVHFLHWCAFLFIQAWLTRKRLCPVLVSSRERVNEQNSTSQLKKFRSFWRSSWFKMLAIITTVLF